MGSRNRQFSKLVKHVTSGGQVLAAGLSDGGGGVTVVDSDGPVALGSGSGGDLKFATKEKTLHLYNGANWVKMSGADESPFIAIEPGDVTVETNEPATGDSCTTTITAKDPEGFNLIFDVNYLADSSKKFYINDSSNLPPHLLHPAQISIGSADSAGYKTATYRFLTRNQTDAESDGSGNALTQILKNRYLVSDGVNTTSIVRQLNISYVANLDFATYNGGGNISAYNGTTTNSFSAAGVSAGYTGPRLRTGKRYMEVHMGADPHGNFMFGWGKEGVSNTWSTTNVFQIYRATSNFYGTHGNEFARSGGNGWTGTTKFMMAWDTTAKKLWMGEGGTWWTGPSSTGGNPGSGGAGFTMPAGDYDDGTNHLCLSYSHGSSGGGSPMVATVKLGKTGDYDLPTGFKYQ